MNAETLVVNCYDVISPTPDYCKGDISECYLKKNSLFVNIGLTFCKAGRDCKLLNYTLPNSAIPYCEQYYSRVMLVVWLVRKYFRMCSVDKLGKLKILVKACRYLKLKYSEQTFEQPFIY